MTASSRTSDDLQRIRALEAELRELRARAGLRSTTPDARIAELLGDVRVLELVPEFISVVDPQLRLVFLNRARGEYSTSGLLGLDVTGLVHPDDAARVRAAYEAVLGAGEAREVEFRSREVAEFVAQLVPVHGEDSVAFVIAISREVTETRAAERALRASEARLRLALRATGMGMWSWSARTNRGEWDETLCRIYGVTERGAAADLQRYLSVIHEDDRARVLEIVQRALSDGVYPDFEHRIRRPDGTERWLLAKGDVLRDESGDVIGMTGGALDVTERHELERRAREVQKLEAISRLTSGIAHNFNNLLGVILPSVALARRTADPLTAARLDDIAHAAGRAADLIRELLVFARGAGAQERHRVDLAELAARTVSMCRVTLGASITLELTVEPSVPAIMASPGQLEQVLLNIVLNARDALEGARSSSAPRITIDVTAGSRDAVSIRVEDNGPGMDDATATRIFEPFFTTKEVGRGTGLGLSSAYAIVAEHGGRIDCRSRVGVGTTFVIELPVDAAAGTDGNPGGLARSRADGAP